MGWPYELFTVRWDLENGDIAYLNTDITSAPFTGDDWTPDRDACIWYDDPLDAEDALALLRDGEDDGSYTIIRKEG